MKKMLLIAALVLSQAGFSQKLSLPKNSSAQKIEQGLGTTKITVNYNRPSVKGRKVFGGLVPYGEVWRTGADKITDITFEKAVSVNGKEVAAGKYGLATIPGEKTWTIILTAQTDIWGVYEYDKTKDVLRFDVPAKKLNDVQETLSLNFEAVTPFQSTFQIRWDKTLVEFPITIDQDAEIEKGIADAISRGDKVQFSAAMFYLNNGKDLKKALGWMKEIEEGSKELEYYWYWRGRIEAGLGQKKEALASGQKGLALAEKVKNDEYIRLNKELVASVK